MKGTKYMAMGGAAKSEMKANPGMGKMPKSVVDALEGHRNACMVGTAWKSLTKKLGAALHKKASFKKRFASISKAVKSTKKIHQLAA